MKQQLRGSDAQTMLVASSGGSAATGAKLPQSYTEPLIAVPTDDEASIMASPRCPEVYIRANRIVIVDRSGALLAVAPLDASVVSWPELRK